MFDIGWSELVVIAVVALIAIGPKELPGVLRSVGYWMGKVRQMASEFQGQFQEAMREAEMADLKKHADDLNNMAKGITSAAASTFDPYDTLKDTQAAATTTTAGAGAAPAPVTEHTPTPASETTTTSAAEALPAPPDFAQVAAMPDVAPPSPEVVAPDTVPPAGAPPAVKRDA